MENNMAWEQQERSVTLTNAEWNRLSCFILMTTNYREGERAAWLKLAAEKHPNGEPVFPNAPEMAEYWKSMDEDLNRMRGIIDGLSLDEILAEAAGKSVKTETGGTAKAAVKNDIEV